MRWDGDEADPRIEAAKRHLAGERASDLAKEFGVSPVSVCNWTKRWLAHNGQEPRLKPLPLPLRHNAFSEATPDAAYWIGFITADGCVHGNKLLSVKLAPSDREHLVKLRAFLGSEHAIGDIRNDYGDGYAKAGTRAVQYQVKSKRIVSDLATFGVHQRKSHTAKVIGLEHDPDFWRGCVDGDGSVYADKKDGKPYLWLYGSIPLLTQFLIFVRRLVPQCELDIGTNGTVPAVGMSSGTALVVIERLYGHAEPAVALDRKLVAARAILHSPWAVNARSGKPMSVVSKGGIPIPTRGRKGRFVSGPKAEP